MKNLINKMKKQVFLSAAKDIFNNKAFYSCCALLNKTQNVNYLKSSQLGYVCSYMCIYNISEDAYGAWYGMELQYYGFCVGTPEVNANHRILMLLFAAEVLCD